MDQNRLFQPREENASAASISARSGAPRERTTNSSSFSPSRAQVSCSSCHEPCSRPAAQIDHRAPAHRGEARELMRHGLRRAEKSRSDLVEIQVDQAKDAVIGKQHVDPGAQPFATGGDRAIPACDPRETAGIAGFRSAKTIEHGAAWSRWRMNGQAKAHSSAAALPQSQPAAFPPDASRAATSSPDRLRRPFTAFAHQTRPFSG